MTGLDPDLRFDKHKAGIQSNRFVFKYGLRLLPALYAVYNPMPYEAAREMEVELAIGLRESGYGGLAGLRDRRTRMLAASPLPGSTHDDDQDVDDRGRARRDQLGTDRGGLA